MRKACAELIVDEHMQVRLLSDLTFSDVNHMQATRGLQRSQSLSTNHKTQGMMGNAWLSPDRWAGMFRSWPDNRTFLKPFLLCCVPDLFCWQVFSWWWHLYPKWLNTVHRYYKLLHTIHHGCTPLQHMYYHWTSLIIEVFINTPTSEKDVMIPNIHMWSPDSPNTWHIISCCLLLLSSVFDY